MAHETAFGGGYAAARLRFLDTVSATGVRPAAHADPCGAAPDGGALYTDVLRLGDENASAVLFINSATHGVEGHAGSGCQTALLRSGLFRDLPSGVAVVVSHALNAHGFAHDRRVTRENVDLNRNFVDHAHPPDDAPGYDELHRHLTPAAWSGPAREAAEAGIAAFTALHGAAATQAAITGGQYSHPDGVFYGGSAPTWPNRLWRGIVAGHAGRARRVGFIDLHTGLGPNGHGELIHIGSAEDPGYTRAADWWGSVTSTVSGTSSSAPVSGPLARAFDALPPEVEVTAAALEFGTVPLDSMLEAVRADNWLYARGDPASPEGRAIKAQILSAFYDDSVGWKRQLADRTIQVVEQALDGLVR